MLRYSIGNHYRVGFKVGSQFAWVDCALCEPGSSERVRATWPIIPSANRIYPELEGEALDILSLLSGLETHTLWHTHDGPRRFELPGPPNVGRRVTNGDVIWLRAPDDRFYPACDCEESLPGVQTECQSGWPLRWVDLLIKFGPLTLVPLTESELRDATLYGPPGQRWGDPSTPCPYKGCALGVGHIGPHLDRDGGPLGQTVADGTTTHAAITPHEASQTPCTCGRPDAHQPGCPRAARLPGPPQEEQ